MKAHRGPRRPTGYASSPRSRAKRRSSRRLCGRSLKRSAARWKGLNGSSPRSPKEPWRQLWRSRRGRSSWSRSVPRLRPSPVRLRGRPSVARGSGLGSSAAKEAVAEEPTALAWLVLGAANRAQAKGSSVRLIVPRAPEVAQELGMDLTDEQFLSVEKYLEDQGCIAPADVSLTWSTYT